MSDYVLFADIFSNVIYVPKYINQSCWCMSLVLWISKDIWISSFTYGLSLTLHLWTSNYNFLLPLFLRKSIKKGERKITLINQNVAATVLNSSLQLMSRNKILPQIWLCVIHQLWSHSLTILDFQLVFLLMMLCMKKLNDKSDNKQRP